MLLLFLGLSAVLDRRTQNPSSDGFSYCGFQAIHKSAQRPFRIGVLGDAQKGLANLRNITRAVMDQDVNLVLQTGDFVSNNDEGHYRLAALYARRGGTVPVIAPGNHDLKGGTERFLRYFLCLEQALVEKDVAFVILNNAFGVPPPDPKHIEERIAAAGPHKAVVLAMHQPPFDLKGNPVPGYEAFLAWLEKSKVAYLLCGHVHTYLKKKVGETTVIINGVGGDYDSWQLDQKVYATILEIDGDKITDRRIELEPVHEVWENVEHLAIGHVAEAYRQKPVLCWLGTLFLTGAVGWVWVRLLRRPKIPKAA
jgi:Icc-related predicted phosphoesterase